jgi:hypothetical protein
MEYKKRLKYSLTNHLFSAGKNKKTPASPVKSRVCGFVILPKVVE